MEVFDPKCPTRKEAPLESTAGRPTVGRCRRRGAIKCEHIRRFGTLGTVASLGNSHGLIRPGKSAGPVDEQVVVDRVTEASAGRAKVVNFPGACDAIAPEGSLR